uniref:Uncharacterized protein n=1 Tax=Timema monikensis TaxID=170555 RepID=A0A7R9HL26_9NEOP|nr:unnamed protein product [Timema monikensis]
MSFGEESGIYSIGYVEQGVNPHRDAGSFHNMFFSFEYPSNGATALRLSYYIPSELIAWLNGVTSIGPIPFHGVVDYKDGA